MHELAARLLKTIRKQELLRPGDRVAAAVSGGADSVALLFLLEELRTELGIVLSVAHVNHKLRGEESDEDERFVANLATRLRFDLDSVAAPIESRASRSAASKAVGEPAESGIEAAARELRYGFFRKLAEGSRVSKIATAHTLDDQAETVLLRIFRGTGIRGLAAIHPRLQVGRAKDAVPGARAGTKSRGTFAAEVIRPLLTFRRRDLRAYLRTRGEPWREDSSNADPTFLRNRVRQRLLPLIAEEFGDATLRHLADLAEIARAEEEYWSANLSEQQPGRKAATPPDATLEANDLLARPLAVQRRQVRGWLEENTPEASISFLLIEEILELARGPAGKKLELPDGPNQRTVRRSHNQLALECQAGPAAGNYEYALAVPGEIEVSELGAQIKAQVVNIESVPEPERGTLLDPNRIGNALTIRNWRAGDRYWPAHTAAQKKVKELLSDRHATGAKKKLWPVAVNQEGSLVWMRGFAAPASLQPRSAKAIWIREIAPQS
jgi:tRNA(Ile)-lysidine synthase